MFVLGEIGTPSSASASEGVADWEESEEERRRRRQWSARGERRRRKRRRNHQTRRGRWVWRVAGVMERVGLVGRRNWEVRRKRRVQMA